MGFFSSLFTPRPTSRPPKPDFSTESDTHISAQPALEPRQSRALAVFSKIKDVEAQNLKFSRLSKRANELRKQKRFEEAFQTTREASEHINSHYLAMCHHYKYKLSGLQFRIIYDEARYTTALPYLARANYFLALHQTFLGHTAQKVQLGKFDTACINRAGFDVAKTEKKLDSKIGRNCQTVRTLARLSKKMESDPDEFYPNLDECMHLKIRGDSGLLTSLRMNMDKEFMDLYTLVAMPTWFDTLSEFTEP